MCRGMRSASGSGPCPAPGFPSGRPSRWPSPRRGASGPRPAVLGGRDRSPGRRGPGPGCGGHLSAARCRMPPVHAPGRARSVPSQAHPECVIARAECLRCAITCSLDRSWLRVYNYHGATSRRDNSGPRGAVMDSAEHQKIVETLTLQFPPAPPVTAGTATILHGADHNGTGFPQTPLALSYGQVLSLGGDFYGMLNYESMSLGDPADKRGPAMRFHNAFQLFDDCDRKQLVAILSTMQKEISGLAKATASTPPVPPNAPSAMYATLGDSLTLRVEHRNRRRHHEPDRREQCCRLCAQQDPTPRAVALVVDNLDTTAARYLSDARELELGPLRSRRRGRVSSRARVRLLRRGAGGNSEGGPQSDHRPGARVYGQRVRRSLPHGPVQRRTSSRSPEGATGCRLDDRVPGGRRRRCTGLEFPARRSGHARRHARQEDARRGRQVRPEGPQCPRRPLDRVRRRLPVRRNVGSEPHLRPRRGANIDQRGVGGIQHSTAISARPR